MSDASTWVLLRGLMRDSRHWGEFPQAFGRAMPGARIELLDFPGNGALNEQTSASSVDAMADYCRAELQRRGLKPPYRLLAMSLGAMAASSWASRHPQELDACVLINTSLRPFSPPHWRLRPTVWPDVLRLALRPPSVRAIERTILRLTSCLVRDPETLLDDWTQWRLSHPVSRANALRQLLAAAKYRAPLQAPATRLLILNSACDALVDNRCSERLAQRWDCEIAVHPRAGHDLPLDDGAWVIEQIRRWI
ncbi:alpha/beta fold hydrolase [Nevskia ramosa]|uniref:alpha/beta fold hydrolase n=1 Tax=Nevskia ramosa TaxID=64002 RepID=UPI003D0F8004